MIRYPNGLKFKKDNHKKDKLEISISSANRGMDFEKDINLTNTFYLEKGVALIYKRTTPINVVKVDYSKGARITDAYFEKQSTTDYNGVYKGKYLDFEAKSTKSKTSFPLANICIHQIKHLENVIKCKGIAFFIIRFESFNEVYLLDAKYVIEFFYKSERKSIPYILIKEKGKLLTQSYLPRIDYLKEVDTLYF